MDLAATPRGRRLLLASLYFSEGAPIGWLWWALPVQLREAGAPVDEITALAALIGLPWALKFLGAPFVDALRGRRWGLRAWAVSAQLGMAAVLLPLVDGVDLAEPGGFVGLLLAHAVLAATQDVAVDAFALRALPVGERGRANGWMQCGMLLGRALFGGLSLWAATHIGFGGVVIALIVACLWSAGLLLVAAREPAAARADIAEQPRFVARAAERLRGLAGMVTARRTWAGLGFALLGGAAFEVVGGTTGTLLVDLGASTERTGLFYAAPLPLAMGAGALLGGRWADGRPRVQAARGALLAVVASAALAGAALLLPGAGPLLVMALVLLVYLSLGALTASSYALFMDLCDPRVAATHFSSFAAATNLCEVWTVWAAGRMLGAEPAARDYGWTWLVFAGVSLLGLAALRALPRDATAAPAEQPAPG